MHFDRPSSIRQAWILSASSRDEAVRCAQQIARAAVCLAGHDVPCGVCRGCRKALAGTHPDILSVRRLVDKTGKLKKDISVSQIRELALDAQVLPGEAERKAYILEEAELMNPSAQNAALKLLEEPPPTVIFLLCTCNPELLLETVRSRCALLRVGVSDTGEEGSESNSLADGFLSALRSGSQTGLWRWVAKNELSKIDETRAFLEASLSGLTDMLCGRAPAGALSPRQLHEIINLITRCLDYLQVNVNAKHVFSLLITEINLGEPS